MQDTVLELILSGVQAEEVAFEIVSMGALGAVEREGRGVAIYLKADNGKLPVWAAEIIEREECEILEQKQHSSQIDYVAQSSSSWFPLHFPRFDIVPVVEGIASKLKSPREILIYPGAGFGTGHHPTTRMMLRKLHDVLPNHQDSARLSAWDIGAGSCVLSLAYRKLFGGEVKAWEIDELAVKNAAINLELNEEEKSIELVQAPFPEGASGEVSCICANLYSSLLLQFERNFHRHLQPFGELLLSGVMFSEHEMITAAYCSSRWQKKSISREGDWLAFHYRKIPLDSYTARSG